MSKRPSNPSTLARQWELLRLLPDRRPGKAASELTASLNARGYDVTKRTVERDLLALSGIFPITNDDRSMPWGWHWMEGTSLDIPAISLSDAVSVRLIEDYLRPLFPEAVLGSLKPRLAQAETKLKAMQNAALARWPSKVKVRMPALPMQPPTIKLQVLADVQTALFEEKMLSVTYTNDQGKASEQTLHPLGLVQRGAVTYLVATAFEYDDVRLYAIHRMKKTEVSDQAARRLKGFDLESYVEEGSLEFSSGKRIKLQLWVNDVLLPHLKETPLSGDMKITPSDSRNSHGQGAVIRCTVTDTWQLRWWLLSQGSFLEVLAPKSLRREIARELADAAARYEGNSD